MVNLPVQGFFWRLDSASSGARAQIKRCRPPPTLDIPAIPKLRRAGASQVVSPYHFLGRRIARHFLHPNLLELMETALGREWMDIETAEVHVAERSSLVGKTLSDSAVRQAAGVMILAVRRAAGGHFEVNPAPETRIGAGDSLIAIGSPDHIKKLESLARA